MAFELLPYQPNDTAGLSFNRQNGWNLQETLTNSEAPGSGVLSDMSVFRRSDDNLT
jgi:hypothetical protein